MKRYETYKESGIQWLGEIPGHWEVVPVKRLFLFGKGLSITKSDLVESGQPVISYGQIHSKQNPGTHIESHLLRYVPMSYAEGNDGAAVSPGDFIFADTSEDLAGCGNAVYIDKEGIYAGYHTIILRSRKERSNNKYLAYLFLTDLWRSQIRSMVFGVKVYSITRAVLSQTSLVIPPTSEQEAIAAYLDDKVGQIDRLIAEKEQQMKELQQYRMSLISETVTRGMNPDVRLKETGIEWIGKIPEHWNAYSLKRLAQILTGSTPSTEERIYWDNADKNWFTPSDFTDNIYLQSSERKVSETAFHDGACRVFPKNTVLIVGIGATIGKVGITECECSANQQINAIIFRNIEFSKYGAYFLFAKKDYIKSIANAATLPILNQNGMKELLIPVPPLSEQIAIASFLDVKTSKIDATLSELQTQIENLRRYKSSVITEAVTGKVNVRRWKQT